MRRYKSKCADVHVAHSFERRKPRRKQTCLGEKGVVRVAVVIKGEDVVDVGEVQGRVLLLTQTKPGQEGIHPRLEVNLATVRETARENQIRANHSMTRLMKRRNSPRAVMNLDSLRPRRRSLSHRRVCASRPQRMEERRRIEPFLHCNQHWKQLKAAIEPRQQRSGRLYHPTEDPT